MWFLIQSNILSNDSLWWTISPSFCLGVVASKVLELFSYESVFLNAKCGNIDIWFIYRCLVMMEWMWSQRIGGKPFFFFFY